MKTDVSAQSEVVKMGNNTMGKFGPMDVMVNDMWWTECKANIEGCQNVR